MKALSIRQPWAWLIVQGHKPLENRTWSTNFRGPMLIHASQGMTQQEYEDVHRFLLSKERLQHLAAIIPAPASLERGGIVGSAELTACVSESDSPWYMGAYGFMLRNARPLPFRPYRGALQFFEVPAEDSAPASNIQPSLI